MKTFFFLVATVMLLGEFTSDRTPKEKKLI